MRYWVCTPHSRMENVDGRDSLMFGGKGPSLVFCVLQAATGAEEETYFHRNWYIQWDVSAHVLYHTRPEVHIGHTLSFRQGI